MRISTSKILGYCKQHFDDIVKIRRDIHMYPEIGFDVQRTASIVAKELENLGIKVKVGVGKTGIVGAIEVPGAKKRIALRADMDALPMQELGNAPYKSKVDGMAHMCGHDVHTAVLIGAARVISTLKQELKSNVRFIFQPSEEKLPGGAPGMIKDGVLDGVDEIYGLHVWPLLEAGQFAISLGPFLGQADFFNLEITGKGGHAALPHIANDPIVIGCQFVTMVQSVISRNVDPLESAVISITKFQGGTTNNVIPPSVRIEGTIRTLKKGIQKEVRQKFENMVSSIAAAHGARFDLHYQEGYPVTYNHEPCVSKALSIAKELVDEHGIIYPFPPIMGSEDFGYYSEKIPACFIGLGAGNKKKGIVNMCHHPYFDVDESCILYGMAMHTSLALSFEGKSGG